MNISIRQGHVLDKLKEIPDNSIDCIITSSPYYGLRNYGASEIIWDETVKCEHQWGKTIPGQQEMDNDREIEGDANATSGNFCLKCNAWKGELGQEPSYKMFIKHLLQVAKELKRVLKPTGTMFWNLADAYSGSGGWNWNTGLDEKRSISWMYTREGAFTEKPPSKDNDIPKKSQMMIPERFAIGLVDEQGWIKRNTIAWTKYNGMPFSGDDRFTNKWESIFFFTKDQDYWFDLDAVRKPLAQATIDRIMQPNIENQFHTGKVAEFSKQTQTGDMKKTLLNMQKRQFSSMGKQQKYEEKLGWRYSGYLKEDETPLVDMNGANPGDVIRDKSVYSLFSDESVMIAFMDFLYIERPELLSDSVLEVTTRSHSFAHFAVYPETLVEPLIKAGCAKEVCSKCGKPKMPFREKTGKTYNSHSGEYEEKHIKQSERKIAKTLGVSESSVFRTEIVHETRTVWKPSCKCGVPFIPGTVLDPFGGSGTTALVAKKLGRSAILIDVMPEYTDIMRMRLEMDKEETDTEFQEISNIEEYEVDE